MALPDLLDRAVLSRLVAEAGLELVDVSGSVGDTYGFASARAAATVRLGADGAESDVVVKVWDPEAHGLGEIEFYEEWARGLPIRLPRHHASHATDALAMIVIEDLRPVRHADDEHTLSASDAIAVAGALAGVHTATVGQPSDLGEPRWGRTLPSEWHDSRRVDFYERFGAPTHHVLRAIVVQSEMAGHIGRSLLLDAPAGLTHSDVHGDNLVFVDGDPVLLDWAHIGWGPAAHDLASLLFSCTPVDAADEVVAAHGDETGVGDDQIDGALLIRLVVATLGVAKWIPSNDRQERLIARGLRRAEQWAEWLAERRPGLEGLLRG